MTNEEREPLTKENTADWILKQCVTEHRCKTDDALIGWFLVPVADLNNRRIGDMALFNEGIKYATEQGWIDPVKQPNGFRITDTGYRKGSAAE